MADSMSDTEVHSDTEVGQSCGETPRRTSDLRSGRTRTNGGGCKATGPLRPVRLSQRMAAGEGVEPLSADRLRELLKSHAPWELADDGSALRLSRLFPTIRAAVSYIAMVTEIGEAHGYLPDVDLRHHTVSLRVDTNDNAGLTELDFEMARVLTPG